MNEKSWVSLEQHVCLVCGVAFDTGDLVGRGQVRALSAAGALAWPEHHGLAGRGRAGADRTGAVQGRLNHHGAGVAWAGNLCSNIVNN